MKNGQDLFHFDLFLVCLNRSNSDRPKLLLILYSEISIQILLFFKIQFFGGKFKSRAKMKNGQHLFLCNLFLVCLNRSNSNRVPLQGQSSARARSNPLTPMAKQWPSWPVWTGNSHSTIRLPQLQNLKLKVCMGQ